MTNGLSLKLSFIDLNHACNLFLIGNDKLTERKKSVLWKDPKFAVPV